MNQTDYLELTLNEADAMGHVAMLADVSSVGRTRGPALAVAIVVGVCSWMRCAHADEAIFVDKVVAVVGHASILRSDVVATVQSSPRQPKDAPERARAEKEALDLLVDDVLIASDALRRGLQVSELEVAYAKGNVARKIGKDGEARLHDPARGGIPARDYDAAVRAEILKQKWMALVVTPRVRGRLTAEAMADPESSYARMLVAERSRALAELRKSTLVEIR